MWTIDQNGKADQNRLVFSLTALSPLKITRFQGQIKHGIESNVFTGIDLFHMDEQWTMNNEHVLSDTSFVRGLSKECGKRHGIYHTFLSNHVIWHRYVCFNFSIDVTKDLRNMGKCTKRHLHAHKWMFYWHWGSLGAKKLVKIDCWSGCWYLFYHVIGKVMIFWCQSGWIVPDL